MTKLKTELNFIPFRSLVSAANISVCFTADSRSRSRQARAALSFEWEDVSWDGISLSRGARIVQSCLDGIVSGWEVFSAYGWMFGKSGTRRRHWFWCACNLDQALIVLV